jgi:hypothetical protein
MQVVGERQGRILAGASGCISSVQVMPPVDLFEARRCTCIPTVPTGLSAGLLAPDAGALLQGNHLRVWAPPPAGTLGATKIGACTSAVRFQA